MQLLELRSDSLLQLSAPLLLATLEAESLGDQWWSDWQAESKTQQELELRNAAHKENTPLRAVYGHRPRWKTDFDPSKLTEH